MKTSVILCAALLCLAVTQAAVANKKTEAAVSTKLRR
jgi:hypothetical protein